MGGVHGVTDHACIGQRQPRVQSLLPLAVGIQSFPQLPDAVLLLVRAGRERERIEACRLAIHGVVANAKPTTSR